MSLILVILTSGCDSYFERSNIGFRRNKLDGLDLNSNCCDFGV